MLFPPPLSFQSPAGGTRLKGSLAEAFEARGPIRQTNSAAQPKRSLLSSAQSHRPSYRRPTPGLTGAFKSEAAAVPPSLSPAFLGSGGLFLRGIARVPVKERDWRPLTPLGSREANEVPKAFYSLWVGRLNFLPGDREMIHRPSGARSAPGPAS